jgi:membrane-bound lytic murein transglycosylase B
VIVAAGPRVAMSDAPTRCGLRAIIFATVCALLVIDSGHARAAAPDPAVTAFIDSMAVTHNFDRRQLQRWFAQARVQQGILTSIAHPTTALPWHAFRVSHVTVARIRGGLAYWQQHAAALARASAESGVPAELIVATIGIESFYGRMAGGSAVFDALVTLAFNYPPRAELFRAELEQFLLLTRELKMNPLRVKGSYAGALGVPQFLPSSYRRYAVDFDHDGKRDLWNHRDAIGSIANYYKGHGWRPNEPVLVAIEHSGEAPSAEFAALLERGLNPHTTVAVIRRAGASPALAVDDSMPVAVFAAETEAGMRYWIGFNNFYVITRYNRSVNYALAVHELAQELRDLHRAQH